MENKLSFPEKLIERKLSEIGAKVVKATEMSYSAKQLCENSQHLLLDAQTEIADLYESLADVLKQPNKENES